eukprot:gene28242-35065_t
MSWRVLGTIIFVLGNLFTFGSFGFGAQSLLASLESIQFVSNLFFAKYCHNEQVTVRMALATLSIVSGNVLVVIFAQHDATLYQSTGMIRLYQVNDAYHAYLVIAFCLWALTNYTFLRYHNSRCKLGVLLWKHNFMEPFCYAMSSAIIGTQAVLLSKCMSMLIQVSIRGEKDEFETWFVYFILAMWVMLVAYWLQRLDNGLALFPPLFIIPVMQVFFVFFAIVCGGIYFEEFNKFTTSQWIGFVIGVSMILSGVYGLAPTDMVLHTPDNIVVPEQSNTCTNEGDHSMLAKSDGGRDIELGLSKQSTVDKLGEVIQAESELDQHLHQTVKEKPSAEKVPPPSSAAPDVNLYVKIAQNDSQGVQLEEGADSPTNHERILPPTTANGFSTVRLEPLNDNDLSGSSVSKKANRKVVKRGNTNPGPLLADGGKDPQDLLKMESASQITHSTHNRGNSLSNIDTSTPVE